MNGGAIHVNERSHECTHADAGTKTCLSQSSINSANSLEARLEYVIYVM